MTSRCERHCLFPLGLAMLILSSNLFLTVTMVVLSAQLPQADAFTPPIVTAPTTRGTKFARYATQDDTTTISKTTTRRGVLGTIRRAVVGAATLAVFRQGPKVAVADETAPTKGKIVEFSVANLGGVAGETGTFKIQLRPEWAPRGAQRFEVRWWEKWLNKFVR